MTLIDSVDSIIMLYSYAGFPDRSFSLFEKRVSRTATTSELYPEPVLGRVDSQTPSQTSKCQVEDEDAPVVITVHDAVTPPSPCINFKDGKAVDEEQMELASDNADEERARLLRVKRNAMSNLSILLTLMSILVAFTYVSPGLHFS